MTPSRGRVGAAITLGALALVASYEAQRLVALASGEPSAASALATAHTPLFWRAGAAAAHGLMVAVVALFVLGDDDPDARYDRLRVAAWVLVPAIFVLMGVAP